MQGDNHEDSSEMDDMIIATSFDDQYDLFRNSFPADSIVFINNYTSMSNLKVLRRQMRESGLCFMHAPVVLQHYLVSIDKGRNHQINEMEMIDVAKYIATVWKDEKLLNYLLKDTGGSSTDFLKEINFHIPRFSCSTKTLPDPEYEHEEFIKVCKEFMIKLVSFPALVSNFEVDHRFASHGVSFLTEEIIRPKDPAVRNGHHSMVLIGIRPCAVHSFIFLLQNWWRGDISNPLGRFFIEVSGKYLVEAGAQITFVNSVIPNIPTNFPKVYQSYVETSADSSELMYEVNVLLNEGSVHS